MELNKFIDFDALFNFLYKDQEKALQLHKCEVTNYWNIVNFVEHFKEQFNLLDSDCEFNDDEIIFVFERDLNGSEVQSYYIVFNRQLEDFTECSYYF